MDPEGEHRGLERRDGELALREDADEGGREGAVVREHGVLLVNPRGKLRGVMVEDDLLDLRIEGNGLQLAEARGVNRLDDDQAPDRVELETRGFDDVKLVRVETVELADVAVERSGEHGVAFG